MAAPLKRAPLRSPAIAQTLAFEPLDGLLVTAAKRTLFLLVIIKSAGIGALGRLLGTVCRGYREHQGEEQDRHRGVATTFRATNIVLN